jgi:hypothetical protein
MPGAELSTKGNLSKRNPAKSEDSLKMFNQMFGKIKTDKGGEPGEVGRCRLELDNMILQFGCLPL